MVVVVVIGSIVEGLLVSSVFAVDICVVANIDVVVVVAAALNGIDKKT